MGGDSKPTVRMTQAEILGSDSWLIALAALDGLPVTWGLEVFCLGILTKIVQIASAMRAQPWNPELLVLLRQLVDALGRIPRESTLVIPTTADPAPGR